MSSSGSSEMMRAGAALAPGGATSAGGFDAAPGRVRATALALLGFAALVLVVRHYDAPLALGTIALVAGAVPLLLWPETATLLALFLLYINFPGLASQFHGVPRPVAGSFILLLAIPLAHFLVIRHERARSDPTFIGMLLFLGVLLLASLGVKDPGIAADRIRNYALEGLLIYWLVINVIRSFATLRRVIWSLLAAGALLGALTLYQEVTGSLDQEFGGLAQRNYQIVALREQLAVDPDDTEARLEAEEVLRQTGGERTRRAEGPVDEPNRFAQILIVLLPMAVFMYRTGRSRRARYGAAAGGLLVLAGVGFTYSRGALVALAILIVIGLARRWIRPVHLVVGILVLLPLSPLLVPRLAERLGSLAGAADLVTEGRPTRADGAIRGRATAMLAASQAFLDHPVLGVGPGQYRPYYSLEYQQKSPHLKFRDIRETRRAHALYLEIAAELGIIGLAVFLGIVGLLLRGLVRARRYWDGYRPEFADLAIALQLSLVAYLTTAIFLHLAFERYYWVLLAIGGSALRIMEPADPAEREAGPGGVPVRPGRRALPSVHPA